MDLFSTLILLGLIAILCVNLSLVGRLRRSVSAIERRLQDTRRLRAPGAPRGRQPAGTDGADAEEERIEILIAAAVAAMLGHQNFTLREVTLMPPQVDWSREGRRIEHASHGGHISHLPGT